MGAKEALSGFFSRLDKKQLFILIVIFLLAFGVRAHMAKYSLPFEFDSYWHARMLSYLVQDGSVPDKDPLAYYQLADGMYIDKTSPLFWYLGLGIYKIVTLGNPVYSKAAIIETMNIAPALFGAIAAVALFFLIKEIYGRKAGYAAAFLAAVVPAFVYRTMSGFFEPTSIGFMWIVISLYFLARATNNLHERKTALKNAVYSGIFLALLAFSWKGFLFAYLILVPVFVFTLLGVYSKSETKSEPINYVLSFAVLMAIFSVAGFMVTGPNLYNIPIQNVENIYKMALPNFSPLFLVAGAAVAIAAIYFLVLLFGKSKSLGIKNVLSYVRLAGLAVVLAAFLYIALSGMNLSSSGVLGGSIGEESPGNRYFSNKYNLLVLLPMAALILLPLKDFFDRKDRTGIIIFFLAMVTLFMAWIKLKFTFLFGLPLAASAGIVFWFGFKAMEKRHELEKKLIFLFLAFLLLVGVGAGSYFISQQFPNIEYNTGWKEALAWISNPGNVPSDAKMFNWWDEGHWISFLGERAVLIDNRNADGEGRLKSALFLVTEDFNEAKSIIQYYDSDYLVFGDDLIQKQNALAMYAYNSTNIDDPRIAGHFGVGFECSKNTANVTQETTYSCGSNTLSEAQFISVPAEWQSAPNQMIDERTPIFVYRNSEKSRLYALNARTNSTVLAKIWFQEPEAAKLFKEVYSGKGVKVFKVVK